MRPGRSQRAVPRPAATWTLLCVGLWLPAAAGSPGQPASRQAGISDALLLLDAGHPPGPAHWAVRLGVHVSRDGHAIVLAPDPPAVPEAQLVSRPVQPGVSDGPLVLELQAGPQTPTASAVLRVELGDVSGTHFRTLARVDASHPATPLRLSFAAPGGPWRLRLRVAAGAGVWRIRRLVLRQAWSEQGSLRIDAMPVRPYRVRLLAGDGRVADRVLPVRVDPAPGLKLLAPPRVGPWVFWRWELDGVPQPVRQRVLELGPFQAVEALARYRPLPDATVHLRVELAPPPGRGPQVKLAGVPLPADDDAYDLLPGEQVTIEAPDRTDRVFLHHWEVDGTRIEGAGARLVLRVTAETHVRAVYVPLGDMNGDGRVDRDDVDVFVLALADPDAYARQYPGLDRVRRGDFNGDGALDWADIEHFVEQVLRTRP